MTIKELRKKLSMTRRAFGEAIGYTGKNTPRTVARLEAGTQQPTTESLTILKELAESFGTTIDQEPEMEGRSQRP